MFGRTRVVGSIGDGMNIYLLESEHNWETPVNDITMGTKWPDYSTLHEISLQYLLELDLQLTLMFFGI